MNTFQSRKHKTLPLHGFELICILGGSFDMCKDMDFLTFQRSVYVTNPKRGMSMQFANAALERCPQRELQCTLASAGQKRIRPHHPFNLFCTTAVEGKGGTYVHTISCLARSLPKLVQSKTNKQLLLWSANPRRAVQPATQTRMLLYISAGTQSGQSRSDQKLLSYVTGSPKEQYCLSQSMGVSVGFWSAHMTSQQHCCLELWVRASV